MAKLIGSAQSTNFGENLFIRKAQEFLDDQYINYPKMLSPSCK